MRFEIPNPGSCGSVAAGARYRIHEDASHWPAARSCALGNVAEEAYQTSEHSGLKRVTCVAGVANSQSHRDAQMQRCHHRNREGSGGMDDWNSANAATWSLGLVVVAVNVVGLVLRSVWQGTVEE